MKNESVRTTVESRRFVVIMAGGRGERFWPQSRKKTPKHLLPIVGEESMLVQTIARLKGFIPLENIFIITNREQRESVLEQCPNVPADQIIAEPVGRDTAAAVGLAKIMVKRKSPQATFAMLPSDHVIHDAKGFCSVLKTAFEVAESEDVLATIGILPNIPETGYGYIQKGAVLRNVAGHAIYKVVKFVEKPNLETAQKYLASGEYYWNAGMFIWTVSAIEKAFRKHAPELDAGLAEIEQALASGQDTDAVLEQFFPHLKKISIDYAIIEKADNIVTLESVFDWDDVGAWTAVANHYPHDAADNVMIGAGLCCDSQRNLILNTKGHVTTLLGVEDLIVVQTHDATLICHKSRAQDVKKLMNEVAQKPEWAHLL